MPRGESQLGPLRVTWEVPDEMPEAAGGLEHLAPGADLAPAVRWEIELGAPGPLPDAHDAFFGDVRVQLGADAVRVVSPDADLRVDGGGVRGRVRARASLPASIALHALAAHAGLTHLHAAVVQLGDLTILAPGGSGAGKTRLALAVAGAGGELLTDDVVYVDGSGIAEPVRRPPHVTEDTRARFALRALGPVKDGLLPKQRVPAPRGGPAPRARIDRLVFPEIARVGVTRVAPIDDVDVFRGLLASSAFAMLEGAPGRESMLDTLAALAELPAARLLAGPDARATPAVLVDTLRRWLADPALTRARR